MSVNFFTSTFSTAVIFHLAVTASMFLFQKTLSEKYGLRFLDRKLGLCSDHTTSSPTVCQEKILESEWKCIVKLKSSHPCQRRRGK